MDTLKIGEIVQTKKKHPCGEDRWKILRNGADVKAKCLGCGHVIMIPRIQFLKRIKKRHLEGS